MLQQVMVAPGVIEFREVEIPKCESNQVLVKMSKIGICGSDIHVFHGKHPFTSYPITQGHEVSGEIFEIGQDVVGLKVGQKVTIQPQVVCGKCYLCRTGKYNLCEELKVMGFQTTGAASQFFAVDSDKITVLPEGMSLEEGAMIEPLAVAVHALRRVGDVKGLNVAVIGAGPIGNLVAQTAKALGAQKVLVTDISDFRLEKAKECGIDFVVNTKSTDFGEALLKNFGADRADVIFDCAGNDVSMGQAIKHSRKGSMIVLVAVFADLARLDLALLNDKELTLNTSMMYRNEDYVEAVALVNKKKVQLETLISKHFDFVEFQKAYEFIENNRETTMKVIIDLDFIIRLETEDDWFESENVTREAFWNKYRPGCDEHYVLNTFRSRHDFVKDLDYVVDMDGKIVGHIMYCKSEILCDAGQVLNILTFGPVSVLPEFQGKGIGAKLIRLSLERAHELGFGAVAITGDPNYYQRFGFVSGQSMGVYYAAMPREQETPFFMIKELQNGFLNRVSGSFTEPEGYHVDPEEVEKFDLKFPPKVKEKLAGQLWE